MKKNYIKPSIIAVTVVDDNLMQAASDINMGGSKGNFTSGMQQASRGERSSSWEDDEE